MVSAAEQKIDDYGELFQRRAAAQLPVENVEGPGPGRSPLPSCTGFAQKREGTPAAGFPWGTG